MAAGTETSPGQFYVPNLPTEEVFTTPDRRRTEGHVRSTQPLVLVGGTVVRDLEVAFTGGRITDVKASSGADAVRAEVTWTTAPPISARSRSSTSARGSAAAA